VQLRERRHRPVCRAGSVFRQRDCGSSRPAFGRDYIGLEVNPDYVAMSLRRIQQTPRCVLRLQKKAAKKAAAKQNGERMLFDMEVPA
jgi:hypothetical protein